MALGVILINTKDEKEHDVYKELEKDRDYKKNETPHLIELAPLFGEHDILCIAEADNFDVLGHYIAHVQAIDGVVATKVLTGIRYEEKR